MSDGVNPPPPRLTYAQIPANASNHNRLSRLTCAGSSAEGAHVQPACKCGPVSVSTVPALSSTVCSNGIGIAVDTLVTDPLSGLMRHASSDAAADEPPRRPR